MPVHTGPRETVCVKNVKDLAFLALARCRSELELPLNTIALTLTREKPIALKPS